MFDFKTGVDSAMDAWAPPLSKPAIKLNYVVLNRKV